MARHLIFLSVAMLLVACDGGFAVRGKAIASASNPELRGFKIAIIEPKDALHCCDSKVDPSNINKLFTVGPSSETYTVSLECEGYRSYVTQVRYGQDVSPSKPLDLGTIELIPR